MSQLFLVHKRDNMVKYNSDSNKSIDKCRKQTIKILFHKKKTDFRRFLRESAIPFVNLCPNIDNSILLQQYVYEGYK